MRLNEIQKENMAAALQRAGQLFKDSVTQRKITQNTERLRTGRDLCKVSGFVCNLHLISIASTGRDLSGRRYLIR